MGFVRFCVVFLMISMGMMPAMAQLSGEPVQKDTAKELNLIEGHAPGSGFSIVKSKYATLVFSPYVTIRYLNQKPIADSYTDDFGRTSNIDKRNDIQFQKVVLYFKGWMVDPKFRYFLYVWTSNANQGQGAQLVLAGNLQYEINKHFDLGAGIGALPTSRSLFGQWPFWLRQDARPMAEEFFRGSFTTGVWLQGEVTDGLYYKTMLGNNLSQLGVDAGQLNNGFNTWSTALWWTTRDYSRTGVYGDFEKHNKIATMLSGAYTTSNETSQSQPGTNAPENSQIRLSDGTGLFNVDAFGTNAQVQEARYQMTSFNGGIKYQGFSLDFQYYLRWVNRFKVTGQVPVNDLFDHGFDLQASAMLVDRTIQFYSTYSYINGQYGKPWEITGGVNWYLFKNKILRINPEVLYVKHSPVGYYSYPTVVGATGVIFMLNVELFY